jgi:two-component system, cell cycle sensor histidine kinase and response regulator CckA
MSVADDVLVEQWQRLILAHCPVVLYARPSDDVTGPLTWISERITSFLGYVPEECCAPGWWWERVHPDDRAQILAQWPALQRGGRCVFEYRLRHRDGSDRWLRDKAQGVSGSAGREAPCVGAWMEIADRRRLEEQLCQAQKMEAVGQLAAGVAHDFNNVLTVMNGYSELLLSSLDPAEPNRKLVEEMRRAGDRAAALTRQLLVLSRKEVVTPHVLDVNTLVRDLQQVLRRMLGEDIDVRTALSATRPVLADAGQLDQVLLNLAVNARDAMPRGGKLTIETRDLELDVGYARQHPGVAPGPYVLLAMTDSGCGITPAVQAHIFEPFFTTKGARGTGLGLATAYAIVGEAGGHIGVFSEPGQGATFKVYLPWARDETHKGANMAGIPPMPHGRETVLLVEDEDAVRALVRHILETDGYQVLVAHSGAEALDLCKQRSGPIDLLITDVVMPAMGGQQLAETVHGLYGGVRVLFLSGYTDDAIVRRGVHQEQVNFLQKPFTPSALVRTVRDLLDTP